MGFTHSILSRPLDPLAGSSGYGWQEAPNDIRLGEWRDVRGFLVWEIRYWDRR